MSAKVAAREGKKTDSAIKTIERLKAANNSKLAEAMAGLGYIRAK